MTKRQLTKRRVIILGLAAVVLIGAGVVWLRRPEPPRYLQVHKGMPWDQVHEVLGRPVYGSFLTGDGRLHRWYADTGGRVRVALEDNVVVEVEYVPDDPDPSIFTKIATYLRL